MLYILCCASVKFRVDKNPALILLCVIFAVIQHEGVKGTWAHADRGYRWVSNPWHKSCHHDAQQGILSFYSLCPALSNVVFMFYVWCKNDFSKREYFTANTWWHSVVALLCFMLLKLNWEMLMVEMVNGAFRRKSFRPSGRWGKIW